MSKGRRLRRLVHLYIRHLPWITAERIVCYHFASLQGAILLPRTICLKRTRPQPSIDIILRHTTWIRKGKCIPITCLQCYCLSGAFWHCQEAETGEKQQGCHSEKSCAASACSNTWNPLHAFKHACQRKTLAGYSCKSLNLENKQHWRKIKSEARPSLSSCSKSLPDRSPGESIRRKTTSGYKHKTPADAGRIYAFHVSRSTAVSTNISSSVNAWWAATT